MSFKKKKIAIKPCPTPEKRSYSDIRFANRKITELIIKDKTSSGCRAYPCQCGNYHLTSSWDEEEGRQKSKKRRIEKQQALRTKEA